MFRKFLCFMGWHQWQWNLKMDETIYLTKSRTFVIPDRARCFYCGTRYKKKKEEKEECCDIGTHGCNKGISLTRGVISADKCLDGVEVVMALEEEFGIEIADEEAEEINTVEEIIKLAKDKVVRR